MAVTNLGRQVNILAGISGVATGATAAVRMDVNKRYHRIILETTEGASVATAASHTLSALKLLVNGVTMWDIAPSEIMNINACLGEADPTGTIALNFTEPNRRIIAPEDLTSWDMFGQSTFELDLGVATGLTTPAVTGLYEFDYFRNLKSGTKGQVPFLQPVARHAYNLNLPAGTTNYNQLPITAPIMRMWFRGATTGYITNLEIQQDGNKVLEGDVPGINQFYGNYGIKFSSAGTPFAPSGTVYYDTAFIADQSMRPWQALKCANSMNVKITLSSATSVLVVMETLPGGYTS